MATLYRTKMKTFEGMLPNRNTPVVQKQKGRLVCLLTTQLPQTCNRLQAEWELSLGLQAEDVFPHI